jgi:hypothetical protein
MGMGRKPTEYFSTLEAARNFFQRAVQQDGRFRCIRLEEIQPSECIISEEVDLGPQKTN